MCAETPFKVGTRISVPGVAATLTVAGVCNQNHPLRQYWEEPRYVVCWMEEDRKLCANIGHSSLKALQTGGGHWWKPQRRNPSSMTEPATASSMPF